MNNQENQPGSDARVQNAGNTTDSTGLGNDATASGSGASRKASGSAAGSQARGAAQGTTSSQAPSHSSEQPENKQGGQQDGNLLDTALQSGKKWIEDSGVLNSVNDLPNNVKDWSNRAVSRVGDLTTTQKIVGGALLAVGIGYLATRKGKSAKSSSTDYSRQDSGSYGRRNYGYQAPDASASRRAASGSGRTDSGSAYGNSGSRYAGSGSGSSYDSGSTAGKGNLDTSGDGPLGGRSDSGSGFGSASANTDHGARTSESSRKNDDFRSIE